MEGKVLLEWRDYGGDSGEWCKRVTGEGVRDGWKCPYSLTDDNQLKETRTLSHSLPSSLQLPEMLLINWSLLRLITWRRRWWGCCHDGRHYSIQPFHFCWLTLVLRTIISSECRTFHLWLHCSNISCWLGGGLSQHWLSISCCFHSSSIHLISI